MDKQSLLQSQRVASNVLSKALLTNKLSHAYLFAGPQGCNKKDFALLVAQSFVCQNSDTQGFACQKCPSCLRIQDGNYGDLFVLDKSNSTGSKQILKDDIQHLQQFFENTAIEASGKRVYIIHNVENSTSEALNSLLKFLEEPRNNILAILTCSSVEAVLPTIVSRCQVIHFHKNDPIVNLEKPWQVYLASHCVLDETIDELMDNKAFNSALDALDIFMKANRYTLDEIIISIEKDLVIDNKNKASLTYFFECLYHIYRLKLSNNSLFMHYFAKIELFLNNPSNGLLILRQGALKSTKTYYMPLVYEETMLALKKELV